MQVTNPGSAGSGTVSTDGVTIQGDGSAGSKIAIKAVQLSARLSGAGTVASPLDIAGWPITGYANAVTGNAATFATTSNVLSCMLFALPYACSFSKIAWQVTTADAVNTYDLALYTLAGVLVANLGGVHFPATGLITTNTVQGAQTIAPGAYWMCYTGNSGSIRFEGANNVASLAFGNSATASVGGVAPSPMTPPAVTAAGSNFPFVLS